MPRAVLISIIIPVRREELTIIDTLRALERVLHMPYELLVVDDHADSEDRTVEIVKTYTKRKPQIRIVQKLAHDRSGFGPALERGVKAAKGTYTVFVMADLCDDPNTIPVMVKTIQQGWDVVCGSRYMTGGKKIGGPVVQGFFSWLVNTILFHVTGIPTHDASNAFKMFKRSRVSTLSFAGTPGVETSLSLVFQAYKRGAMITEIPTTWNGRTKGVSKFRFFRQCVRYGKVCIGAIT